MAANVLAHGTGALNIDGCRVAGDMPTSFPKRRTPSGSHVLAAGFHKTAEETAEANPLGRWPANLIHDGSDEVIEAFPQAPGQLADASRSDLPREGQNVYGAMKRGRGDEPGARRLDEGSAARFFYCAKASKADRGAANNHPTVKPTELMRHLVRLVTPPGGKVLDPFAGSGSTGRAAALEGFAFLGFELSPEFTKIAIDRISEVS